MERSDERICRACGVAYSWNPVIVEDEEFCCAACSRGQECTCLEHSDLHDTRAMGSRAGSIILGATQGEL